MQLNSEKHRLLRVQLDCLECEGITIKQLDEDPIFSQCSSDVSWLCSGKEMEVRTTNRILRREEDVPTP